jgi:hypothetical protein
VLLKKKTQRHFLRAFYEYQLPLSMGDLKKKVEDKLTMEQEQEKICGVHPPWFHGLHGPLPGVTDEIMPQEMPKEKSFKFTEKQKN